MDYSLTETCPLISPPPPVLQPISVGGEQGRELVVNGLRSGESGMVVRFGGRLVGLVEHMLKEARSRIGGQGPEFLGSGRGQVAPAVRTG